MYPVDFINRVFLLLPVGWPSIWWKSQF